MTLWKCLNAESFTIKIFKLIICRLKEVIFVLEFWPLNYFFWFCVAHTPYFFPQPIGLSTASSHSRENPSTSAGAAAATATPSRLSQQPASSASPSSTFTPNRTFSESAIAKLMGYGFTRQAVMEELRRANGDIDQALAALLAKSLSWQ